MVSVGQELAQPISGERYLVRATAGSSGGKLFAVETTFAPNGFEIVEHQHPAQEERFVVLDGAIAVAVGGEWRRVAVGEAVVVPSGVRHAWRSDEVCRALVEFRPALRTEELFATVARLATEGRLTRRGIIRNPLTASRFVDEFWPEARYTGVFGVLAMTGRRLAPALRLAAR